MTISKQMKKYNSDFKLKVVLSYLSGQSTVAQICTKYEISKATLHKWVKQFKDNSGLVFDDSKLSKKKSGKKDGSLTEKEASKLYAKIGRLTMERDFLKKVLDT